MSTSDTIGDVIFFCGADAHAHVIDEHDVFANRYCDTMNREHFERTGEYAGIDQQCEWITQGRVASERRLEMRESVEIDAAIALLERHGYAVVPRTESE